MSNMHSPRPDLWRFNQIIPQIQNSPFCFVVTSGAKSSALKAADGEIFSEGPQGSPAPDTVPKEIPAAPHLNAPIGSEASEKEQPSPVESKAPEKEQSFPVKSETSEKEQPSPVESKAPEKEQPSPVESKAPEKEKASPVLVPEIPEEDNGKAIKTYKLKIEETRDLVRIVDENRLTKEQQDTFNSIHSFLEKSQEAFSQNDMSMAVNLAEKANTLAKEIVRNSPKD